MTADKPVSIDVESMGKRLAQEIEKLQRLALIPLGPDDPEPDMGRVVIDGVGDLWKRYEWRGLKNDKPWQLVECEEQWGPKTWHDLVHYWGPLWLVPDVTKAGPDE